MSHSSKDIKSIIKSEYVLCAKDPVYFIKKYCFIQHPMRGRIIFHLYPFQEKTLALIQKDQNSIILKSRQLGISTLVAGYTLWLMLFHKDKNVLCIATKQDTAKNMVTKVRFMYDNLPSWLRGKEAPLENSKLTLKLFNGSQVKATSAAGDAGRSEAVSLLVLDESAFIPGISEIWSSAQQTLSTGGKCIALSTPYGTGNWFHQTWVHAEEGVNGFQPIRLPWFVHPERDQKWRDKQDKELGAKEAAQECDCSFNTSGDVVFNNEWLQYIEDNQIQDPVIYRGQDNNLWVWENVDYSKDYMILADVARGDGKDYSTAHVMEIKSNVQVAEYRGHIPTRQFAQLLVALATEYNNALLVPENSNVGWSTVENIVEMGYKNLYYSTKSDAKSEDDYLKVAEGTGQLVPGFTMSLRTRPLCINKFREYLGDRSVTIRSRRLLEEMRVFVWKNGKAEAQNGYNDDLVMPMSMGMYLRDSSLKFQQHNLDMTRAALSSIKTNNPGNTVHRQDFNIQNPYKMDIGNESIDLKWLL